MRARAGITLLELLLVVAILGVVLGAGVGMFASLDLGRRQARGLVKNVLRAAQGSAIAQQAPARVRIDDAGRTITAEALVIVGTWRFEGSLAGAEGLGGDLKGGARFVDDGYIGSALSFSGQEGTLAEIPIHLDPAFDLRDGFRVSCALRREGKGGGQAIQLGEVAALEVTNDGSLRGWFIPSVTDKDGVAQPGARVLVDTRPGLARPDRWIQVALEYDRDALALLVDGRRVAERAESAEVWTVASSMLLGGKRYPFQGSIDDLVIGCVVAGEETALPESMRFTQDSAREVRFAPGGGLDRDRHPTPAVLVLEHEGGERESLIVGAFGTVDG